MSSTISQQLSCPHSPGTIAFQLVGQIFLGGELLIASVFFYVCHVGSLTMDTQGGSK